MPNVWLETCMVYKQNEYLYNVYFIVELYSFACNVMSLIFYQVISCTFVYVSEKKDYLYHLLIYSY